MRGRGSVHRFPLKRHRITFEMDLPLHQDLRDKIEHITRQELIDSLLEKLSLENIEVSNNNPLQFNPDGEPECGRSIIIYNIRECEHVPDKELVQDIFKEIHPGSIPIIKVARFEAVEPCSSIRPIKITCQTQGDVLKILQNKQRYQGPGIIVADQTYAQRKPFYVFRKELEKQRAVGARSKTMKYVNGAPKILDSDCA